MKLQDAPTGSSGTGPLPTALAEINVTPFVDVMLVLLVVFMVSAPLMQQGMQVELPKANTGALREVPDQVVVVLDRQLNLYINKSAIAKNSLLQRLQGMAKAKPQLEVFVHADKHVPYGSVAEIVAMVKKAQIHRVGLVTLPEQP